LKFKDPQGRIREGLYFKKVKFPVRDAVHGDTLKLEEYVEVKIKGRNREWVQWYKYDEFKRLNPHIVIENAN